MDISPEKIGRRIRNLRKQKGLSQEDIARILQIPRSSVAQIENGNRQVSFIELATLSESIRFSLDNFLSDEYESAEDMLTVSEPEIETKKLSSSEVQVKTDKLQQVILYILEHCGGKSNVDDYHLLLSLYFCDFNYYEIYETHLTGLSYYKHARYVLVYGYDLANEMFDGCVDITSSDL